MESSKFSNLKSSLLKRNKQFVEVNDEEEAIISKNEEKNKKEINSEIPGRNEIEKASYYLDLKNEIFMLKLDILTLLEMITNDNSSDSETEKLKRKDIEAKLLNFKRINKHLINRTDF